MHKGKAILYFQMIKVTTREEIESLGLCEEMKIGEGTETFILSFDDLMKIEFSPDDYKNTRGHVALIAGSRNYVGAARMAGESLFHSGTGLVTVITDEDAFLPISLFSPFIMRTSLDGKTEYDSYVIGPGWGRSGRREYLFLDGKKVIDADAISLIEKGDCFSFKAVITPHLGEYRKLKDHIGMPDATEEEVASALEAVIVLKTSIVSISDGKRRYLFDGANPSLGVAGSGDVLSGIIGFYLTRRDPENAAINGVLHHQKAGLMARDKFGFFDALDLIDQVGLV